MWWLMSELCLKKDVVVAHWYLVANQTVIFAVQKKVVTFYEDNILPFLQGSLNIGPRLGKVGDTSF
jgi:hypothetical protein